MRCGYLLALLLVLTVAFAVKFVYDAGEFKQITALNNGNCELIGNSAVDFTGVEDFQIDYPSKTLILAPDVVRRRVSLERSKMPFDKQSTLWGYDLKSNELFKYTIHDFPHEDFHAHGISLLRSVSAEKSALLLYVINHRRDVDSIDVFRVDNRDMHYLYSVSAKEQGLIHLNDLHVISESEFYVSTWHVNPLNALLGRFELLTKRSWAYVSYCTGDLAKGEVTCRKAAESLITPNGMVANGTKFFIATVLDSSVHVYDRKINGELEHIDTININCGADNLNLDEDGNILVGCHPKQIQFLRHTYAGALAPSEVVRIRASPSAKSAFSAERIFQSDGSDLSASSVAASFENQLFIGGVFDQGILKCTI